MTERFCALIAEEPIQLAIELTDSRGKVQVLEQKLLVAEKIGELNRVSLCARVDKLGAQIAALQATLTKRNSTIGRLRAALRECKAHGIRREASDDFEAIVAIEEEEFRKYEEGRDT